MLLKYFKTSFKALQKYLYHSIVTFRCLYQLNFCMIKTVLCCTIKVKYECLHSNLTQTFKMLSVPFTMTSHNSV